MTMHTTKPIGSMDIVYALEQVRKEDVPSIFLAGPTPRSKDVPSWRPEAIRAFEELGFEGNLFVPEPRDGKFTSDYYNQIEWELDHIDKAHVVMFWIPRDLETMPGFTTNVEFGLLVRDMSKVLALGHPEDAPKMRYLDALYAKYRNGSVPPNTVQRTCELVKGTAEYVHGCKVRNST